MKIHDGRYYNVAIVTRHFRHAELENSSSPKLLRLHPSTKRGYSMQEWTPFIGIPFLNVPNKYYGEAVLQKLSSINSNEPLDPCTPISAAFYTQEICP